MLVEEGEEEELFSEGESFEMMFVAFGAIWVFDWIERRVISWVSERAVSSKAMLSF